MFCHSVAAWITGYADGQLDGFRSWLTQRHLQVCANCAAKHQEILAMRTKLRADLPYYRAPPQLHARLAELAAQAPPVLAAAGPRSKRERWRWLTVGALAGCAATLTAMVGGNVVLSWREQQDFAVQAVADHVRATLGDHLIEVASSDQHTVKPWLSERLDYSPPVPDMANAGFTLIGARLETFQRRPIATLVYRYRLHTIDVFVRPEPSYWPVAPRSLRGFNVAHAQGSQMEWLAVSDVSSDVLESFVGQLAGSSASR
jgi:anti-sigma factor RsiW